MNCASLAYAVCSIAIIFVNKLVLTVWKYPYPHVLAFSQFCCTAFILGGLRFLKLVQFDTDFKKIWPLSLLYLGNVLFGLSGTHALSIPMFTVFRRTNLLMTIALEWYVLGIVHSRKVWISVALMIVGAIVSADGEIHGFWLILINNAFTSLLNVLSKKHDVMGFVFTNSILCAALMVVAMYPYANYPSYEHWHEPEFVFVFALSSIMGCLLQLSACYCSQMNSPLTTVGIGVSKNIVASYFSMLFPNFGYEYTPRSFFGITVSMIGAITFVLKDSF